MIRDRRVEQVKETKRAPKKATTVDKAAGAGRAKRSAATAARRGMTNTSKPSPMEVEKEVYRQSRRTATTKEKQVQKSAAGRLPPKAKPKNERKKDAPKKNAPKQNAAAPAIFGGRTPSRKAIEAAVNGMETGGFKVPKGMQVIITFVPAPEPTGRKPAAKNNQPAKGSKAAAAAGRRPAAKQAPAKKNQPAKGGKAAAGRKPAAKQAPAKGGRKPAANQNKGGGGNQNQGGRRGGDGEGRRARR